MKDNYTIFIIKNYLLKKLVRDLDDLKNNPDDYIIELHSESDKELSFIESKLKETHRGKISNLDGGVRFILNGKEIIGFEYWDEVDVIWTFLLNAIENFLLHGKGVESFPEQPIEILLESINSKLVSFSIDSKRMVLNKELFLNIILKEAQDFFELLQKLKLTSRSYQAELSQINRINKLRETKN